MSKRGDEGEATDGDKAIIYWILESSGKSQRLPQERDGGVWVQAKIVNQLVEILTSWWRLNETGRSKRSFTQAMSEATPLNLQLRHAVASPVWSQMLS